MCLANKLSGQYLHQWQHPQISTCYQYRFDAKNRKEAQEAKNIGIRCFIYINSFNLTEMPELSTGIPNLSVKKLRHRQLQLLV